MKIDLIANDGSPLSVTPETINGNGVGGAELAMMTLMRAFAKRGHDVTVYNDSLGIFDGVNYTLRRNFQSGENRDALIIFRSPNPLVQFNRLGDSQSVVWWSCDQHTTGSFHDLGRHPRVDFCVTISPYHTDYHLMHYSIPREKIGHIDIGVRTEEYEQQVDKIQNRMIFCSVPDRGAIELAQAWPKIVDALPDASLVITSDYRLWGVPHANNAQYQRLFRMMKNVQFMGRVPRPELVKLQLQSEIMAYPCTYEELFCIAAAECQVAGAIPVTSGVGALPTTNEIGKVLPGFPTDPGWIQSFAATVVDMLTKSREELVNAQTKRKNTVWERFNYDNIAEQWEYLFAEGKLQ